MTKYIKFKPKDNTIDEKRNKYVIKTYYAMNDLGSVYTHYDPKLGINVPTENIIKDGDNDGKGSK